VDDLLGDMRLCKSVRACIDLALTDAYGEDEEAVAWLTCIETMFGRFKRVKLLGEDVTLAGFDLNRHAVIAVCRKGSREVHATLDSIEFPELTPADQLWLRAWKKYSVDRS
jgi:hypothetical protein